jgi:serine/threonine protein kinase/tetratricopeptide (TPR) repeat protein
MISCVSCGTDLVPEANFCFKCGAPRAAIEGADPLVGMTVGAYRIVAPLGEGAMGRTYRAEQLSLGREVCVKTLLPHLVRDAHMTQRFEREARAASALKHPNVVGVLDVGRTGTGLLYIVMELVQGKSLRAIEEQEGPLALDRTLTLTEQILSALEEAHGAGVVHRDLKPENVLIARLRDGTDLAKVADFGLAKLLDQPGSEPQLTRSGMIFGTPGYMAPEQVVGEEIDHRADIYAVGVILYELLASRRPFRAGTPNEIFSVQLGPVPPAPSTVAKLPVPVALDEIVLRAMHPRREGRFRSALEFKHAVAEARSSLRGEATRAPPAAASPSPSGAAGTPPQETETGPFESLQRLMPQKLVHHISDLSQLLSGERRTATVLFGDISGFTSMSEKLPAEEVRNILNRCFDGMVEAVHRYDGTVDKFIGDCIMVLFGVPHAHEDDSERAVRCALEMLAYLDEVNKTLVRPLNMRIGINSGELVAGGVGGQRRMDYTVMGDVVNVAQRLEGSARVGTILVSRPVMRATEDAITYRPLSAIRVKGREEPLDVFEVAGLKGASSQPETELIGFSEEKAAIAMAIENAGRGRGDRCLLVVGDAGFGKSRLLDEGKRIARSRGLIVGGARGGRLGGAAHLDLMRQSVFSLCGGLPSDAPDANRRLSTLASHGLDGHSVERLRHLFGGDAAPRGFERDDNRLLDRAALLDAFLATARQKGLCLLLDDLHLADPDSLRVVEELLARSDGARFALIAAARPGETDRLLSRVRRIELRPLATPEVLEVAKLALGGSEVPQAVRSLILQRAEGNPWVARELIRALIDKGGLTLTAGSWHATPSLVSTPLPDRVAQLVESRLDAVSVSAKRLLRTASVAGRVFCLETVLAAIDPPIDASTALAECRNRGFLVPSEQPGCYQFAQAITFESVLGSITRTDARAIHERLANAVEKGLGTGGDHPADALARHFLAAEQYRKAVQYLLVSADRMADHGAPSPAADAYLKALEISLREGSRLGNPSDTVGALLYTLAAKATACLIQTAPDRALEVLTPVLAAIPADRALPERAEALRQKGLAFLKLSKLQEAEATLKDARACVSQQQDPDRIAGITADLAAVAEARGDSMEAARLLLDGFRLFAGARSPDRDLTWRYLNQLGRVHLRMRQFDRAREFFENARQQAQRAGSAVGESRSAANLAGVLASQGDHAGAQALWAEAMEIAKRVGDRVAVARIHYNVGRLQLSAGRLDEAAVRLESAATLAGELNWREGQAAAIQALDGLRARNQPPRPGGNGER